jgi:xanthine dehydrogenase/oxidase
MGAQYHFHMETQLCLCVPKEDGIDVFSSTQWADFANASVAQALGIQNNE